IKVLTGLNTGTSVPLIKDETTIGRPGFQVAAIVKSGSAFLIKRIEGGAAPTVNGQIVAQDGTELAHGDRIDIAGATLEFVMPEEHRASPIDIEDSLSASPAGDIESAQER